MTVSAREMRARAIYDLSGGHERFWTPKIEAWTRAVEWFETRPAPGDSAGERLLWCMVRLRARDYATWSDLDGGARDLYERMAGLLLEHGRAQLVRQPSQHHAAI